MLTTPCPERDELERGLLGMLPESQAEQFEKHLESCGRCVATLGELDRHDTLVEALRAVPAAAADLAPFSDQVRTLVERWSAGDISHVDTTPSASSALEATSELGTHPEPPKANEDEETDFLAPPQAPDELGRLGNYRVLRVLGTGGMGVVFEAEDPQLKRRVALKAMKPAVAASASSRRRFVREAQTAAAVEHDHVVPIYQVAEDRGVPFIAMPLLRGETLGERLARGPLATADVIRIGREIALGLEAAHQVGLVHRDIKPANIWLEAGSGRVKILDFGLARVAGGDEQITRAGTVLGTPSYMAPEQGRGETIDARADVFSLGCVLYHCATGSRPFVGRDPLSTLLAVTMHNPPPPRELNPDLPEALSQLIVSLLSKDPAGRPQSAHEVVGRLAVHLPPGEGRGEGGLRILEDGLPSPSSQGIGIPESRSAEDGEEIGNCKLQIANCKLEGVAETNPKAKIQNPKSLPPRRRWPVAIAAAAAAAALVFGVVIIIKDREGKVVAEIDSDNPVKIKVPDGHSLEVVTRDAGQAAPTPGALPPHALATKSPSQAPQTQGLGPKFATSNSKSLPTLSSMALVTEPARLEGVKSWTVETIAHRGRIYEADYSPDGKWLATLGADAAVRLWDPTTGKLARALVGHSRYEGALAWSPDSAQVAVVDIDAVRIWEAATGRLIKTLPLDRAYRIHVAAWSHCGKTLAVGLTRWLNGNPDGRVELFDVDSGERLDTQAASWSQREYTNGGVPSQTLCWSPDSQRLAFGNSMVWNIASGQVEELKSKVGKSACWRGDGALLTTVCEANGKDIQVQLWRADSGELLHTILYTDPGLVEGAADFRVRFSHDGSALLTAASEAAPKRGTRLSLWSTASGELIKTIPFDPIEEAFIQYVASSDAHCVAAFGSTTGSLRLVSGDHAHGASYHPALVSHAHSYFKGGWSPDGRTLALRDMDRQLVFLDIASGRASRLEVEAQDFVWRDDASFISAIAFDPLTHCLTIDAIRGNVSVGHAPTTTLQYGAPLPAGGRNFIYGDSDHVYLYQTSPPKLLQTFDGKSKFPPVLSPDGSRLAIIDEKTTIYSVETGQALKTFTVAAPVEWSPDGKLLAYAFGTGERFEVRGAESGELVTTLTNEIPQFVSNGRLAWSPDSSRLAGFGRVWDSRTGAVTQDLPRYSSDHGSLAPTWSPDGELLAYRAADTANTVAQSATGRIAASWLSFLHGRSLGVSPRGHVHCSPRFESELIYVVDTDAGQASFSPQEFADRFGWINDPAQVRIAEGSGSYTQRVPGVQGSEEEKAEGKRQQAEEGTGNREQRIENPKSLGPLALVQRPARLPGVESWSLESATPVFGRSRPGIYALNGEGSLVAVGGLDGHVRVFEPFSGNQPRLKKLLIGQGSQISALEFSPKGNWLASAEGGCGAVRVWNAATGSLVSECSTGLRHVDVLSWSPDGTAMALCGAGGVRVIDPRTGEVVVASGLTWRGHCLSWSPDSQLVVVAEGHTARIWDPVSGEIVRALAGSDDESFIGALAWSHDGRSIAGASNRGVRIWSILDGAVTKQFDVADILPSLIAWGDHGSTLRLLTKHGGEVWDIVSGTKTADSSPLNPNERRSANGRVTTQTDESGAKIIIFDSGKRKHSVVESRTPVNTADWSSDGLDLASGALNQVLIANGSATNALSVVTPPHPGSYRTLAWLNEPRSLLVSASDIETAILTPGKNDWTNKLLGIPGIPFPLGRVSPDGRRLFTVPGTQPGGGFLMAAVWDVANVQRLIEIGPHSSDVTGGAWSPDGAQLVTGARTGEVAIWDAQTGQGLKSGRPSTTVPQYLYWSPKGDTIAVCYDDGVVRLCDTQLQVRHELPYHYAAVSAVCAFNWSNDGATILTADATAIRRWDVKTGKLLGTARHGLPSQPTPELGWQFSPDNTRLVTTGSAARVWNTATGDLQASLVPLADRRAAIVSVEGHYLSNTPLAENNLVHVVQTANGQELFSPKEFTEKYGWKNDPSVVHKSLEPTPIPDLTGALANKRSQKSVEAAKKGGNKLPRSEAIGPLALVTEPAAIEGLKSWTVETIGHRGGIHEAEYSPDGKWLATRGDDGTIRLWNPSSGKLARILVGHDQGRGLLAWSADGAQLAAIDFNAIRLWEAGTGKLLKTLPMEPASTLFQAGWSPDGKTMAVGLARNVDGQRQYLLELIEVESGDLLDSRPASWREPNGGRWAPQNLCWSPDSDRLAYNSTILHVDSGQTKAAAGKLGTSFAWRADGALLTAVLTTVDGACKVELWRADTGEFLSTLPGFAYRDCDGGLPPVQFSPRGDALLEVAISSLDKPSEALIWNTTTYETIKTIALAPYYDTGDFRVAPEGAGMASFGWYAGTLRIVNPTGMEHTTFDRPALMSSQASFVAAWSPSSDMLAARGEDERIGFWDLASGRRRALSASPVWTDSLTWQADEPLLDAWFYLGGVTRKAIIDGDAGHVRRSEDIIDAVLVGAQFRSNCGSAFAVAHADRVRIFAGDPPRLLRELETASKFTPALSPDGRRLATIADKTTIWDLTEGKSLASFDVAAPVEWSPDGQRLAYTYGNGERFEVRSAESGELLTELRLGDPETSAKHGPITAAGARLAWSPDGSRIAGFGRVWNASSGEAVCDLRRFDRQANTGQPAWSPDGAYLAYCAPDRAFCIADATTGQVVDHLFSFTRGRALAVSPSGHYRASPRFDTELVYVIETDAGQEMLSPQEFADRYGWRNDPSLAGMGDKVLPPLPRQSHLISNSISHERKKSRDLA